MLSSWKLTPLRLQLIFTLQRKNKTFSQAQTKKARLNPEYVNALGSLQNDSASCHRQ